MKYPDFESSILEFKQELPKNEQIIKTAVGFCNQNGGKIVIGVSNTRDVIGVSETEIQRALEYLDKTIYETSSPPILPLVHAQRMGDKALLLIEISKGMNKPHYVKSEGLERGVYVRLGRNTLRANADLVEELKWQSRGLSFDTLPVYHAQKTHLEIKKLKKWTDAQLLASHILAEEHGKKYPTAAGLLLFSSEPQRFFPEAITICTHFSGMKGREAIASLDCSGTLFQQLDTAYDFILSRLSRSYSIRGKKRVEKLEIPEIAIREILINALVHRNYHIPGPIKIAIYDHQIEIFSPGCFPGPLVPNNLHLGLTYIRNVGIGRIFREAGLIEKLGSGFLTVFDSYAQAGLLKPEIIEGENYIKCVLPRVKDRAVKSSDSTRILALLSRIGEISISDIIKDLGLSRASAGRKLSTMVTEGLLVQTGSGRMTRYHDSRS